MNIMNKDKLLYLHQDFAFRVAKLIVLVVSNNRLLPLSRCFQDCIQAIMLGSHRQELNFRPIPF